MPLLYSIWSGQKSKNLYIIIGEANLKKKQF